MNFPSAELDAKASAELAAWFETFPQQHKLAKNPWRLEIVASCVSGFPDVKIRKFLSDHSIFVSSNTMAAFRKKILTEISAETKEAIMSLARRQDSSAAKSMQLKKALTAREVNQKVVSIIADVIVGLQQEKERGNNTLSDKRLELLSKYCQQYVELNEKLEKENLESERGNLYKQIVSDIGKMAAGYITDDKFKVEFLQKIETYLQEHC